MIQVNVQAEGVVKMYSSKRHELKNARKEYIQKELEKLEFTDQEVQKELKQFAGYLLMAKYISLGNRKEYRIDLYMDIPSFGRKKPEITITENYPLYNMLKKFTE